MSKELPYFKFIPAEYLLGTISFQKEKIQGTFILVCCHYWQRSCDLTLTLLNQLLSKSQANVEMLIKNSLLKHDKTTDKINIDFLDEQWIELNELYQKRSRAGSIGGQASVKQRSSIKKEIKINKQIKIEKEIRKEKLVLPFSSIDFIQAWEVLLKEKKWRKKSFSALQASLQKLSVVPEQDAIQMIKNTIAGEWQGFFELEKNKNKYNGRQNGKLTDEGLANAWAEDIAKTASKHS